MLVIKCEAFVSLISIEMDIASKTRTSAVKKFKNHASDCINQMNLNAVAKVAFVEWNFVHYVN